MSKGTVPAGASTVRAWPEYARKFEWLATRRVDGDPVSVALDEGGFVLGESTADGSVCYGDVARPFDGRCMGKEFRELYDHRVRALIGKRFDTLIELAESLLAIRNPNPPHPSHFGRK